MVVHGSTCRRMHQRIVLALKFRVLLDVRDEALDGACRHLENPLTSLAFRSLLRS